jgi:hypothetical protein
MGTMNAFYVRALGPAAVELGSRVSLILARRMDRGASIEVRGEYIGARVSNAISIVPEAEVRDLSRQLATDVLWLSFQSVVDAFAFHHWRAGAPVRSLVYGYFEERVWERVEGTQEPWEAQAFFDDAEGLTDALEVAEGDETEQAELRRMWRDKELRVGKTEPVIDARSCAHEIARHYGLPHYGGD